MQDTDSYLAEHYRTATQFSADCSISVENLAAMIEARLIPEPSYVVTDDGKFVSQAFGELPAQGGSPGQYFHPGNAPWIATAMRAVREVGASEAHQVLKSRFTANFATALEELDKSILRLTDSFTASGEFIQSGLARRTDAAWGHHLKGVFGLCVSDPSTEISIARKEILQEALSHLTDVDSTVHLDPDTTKRTLALIKQYAKACMPFSPPEYPRSSRKRLVDDLQLRLTRAR